jgi:hypothetical protein
LVCSTILLHSSLSSAFTLQPVIFILMLDLLFDKFVDLDVTGAMCFLEMLVHDYHTSWGHLMNN